MLGWELSWTTSLRAHQLQLPSIEAKRRSSGFGIGWKSELNSEARHLHQSAIDEKKAESVRIVQDEENQSALAKLQVLKRWIANSISFLH
ncbi:hypothetical protein TorRG33x02_161750 [Trema orientale]|uniref:Uncharacterized protein n=1 Tax=Trema orientale TaxID=63057 RepID=A0A2P5ER11_TREOI|nr:hypothetical protein TorRG33x02_161750 [Trema orientale]